MAKKVRFPLEMENEVQVRTMEELRENFSIFRVLSYLKEGRLVVWLRDRYANDMADSLENLDMQDKELVKKVCEIFEVPYDRTVETKMKRTAEKENRVQKLRGYTDDKQYENVIENVAFEQDELYDLLEEEVDKIYLCGERFFIPLEKSGVTYIGVNNPTVVIDSKVEVDWNKKGITLEKVTYDDKYKVNTVTQQLIQKLKSMSDIEIRNLLEESYPYTAPEMNRLYRLTEQFTGALDVLNFLPDDINFGDEIEGKSMYRIARFIGFFHAEYKDIETRNYNLSMTVYVFYKIIVAILTKDVSSCRDAVAMLDIVVNGTLEKNKDEVAEKIYNLETLVKDVNSHLKYIVSPAQGFRHVMGYFLKFKTDIANVNKQELFSWTRNLNIDSREEMR